MEHATFSLIKRHIRVGEAQVAYYDEGTGEPVVLLHGCPFSSFVWRNVIRHLSGEYRCLAPDLLGLGDTETPPGADWSVQAQADMVIGWLDALRLDRVHLVGHDHGGATAQLIAAGRPQRIERLVLANAEAYDNWPSSEEKPFIVLTQLPLLGPGILRLWSIPAVTRLVLTEGSAVKDKRALTPEFVRGMVRDNLGDAHRRAKTRRFLAGQLDPRNDRSTLDLLAGLRRFNRPTMIVWGEDDPHFGSQWAQRLYQDIPGACRLELLPDTGHLLMEEKPAQFASLLLDFFKAGANKIETEARVAR